ncbi:MAG: hypothetical protein D6753_12915 [Planctomycetota bacterium]|nr:MAG: hypothetical protein D6753_12915 [Planctomycetota bacterium]
MSGHLRARPDYPQKGIQIMHSIAGLRFALAWFVASSYAIMVSTTHADELGADRASSAQPDTVVREIEEDAAIDGELHETRPLESSTAVSPGDSPVTSSSLTFTAWAFEVDLVAFQHEPARKNVDRFEAKLEFAAIVDHAGGDHILMPWMGFGTMTANVVSRAPNSQQAPHRPLPLYFVYAQAGRLGANLYVAIHPRDKVTYSLLSGHELGTINILRPILLDATADGLPGSLACFAIPLNTPVGTEFHCTFNTADQHVCWFEGTATLRVVRKVDGKFLTPERQQESDAVGATSDLSASPHE